MRNAPVSANPARRSPKTAPPPHQRKTTVNRSSDASVDSPRKGLDFSPLADYLRRGCFLHRGRAAIVRSELPPLPLFARVPLAIWWLAHFAAGTALVEFADALVQEGLLWHGFSDGVAALVFGYLFHFAANVFLVLAVTACLGSPRITAGVWRRRFTIDALFTFPLLLRMVF